MADKIFADGMIAKSADKAPDFVKLKLSIKIDEFAKWLSEHRDGNWINLQVCESRGGKLYVELDNWKPSEKTEGSPSNKDFDDIPF